MITQDKITDIFCMVDEFSKKFDMEIAKGELISSNGIRCQHRNASLSDGEIMTILIVFHFGTFANFKPTICIISGYICIRIFRMRYPITGLWNLKAVYSSS